jgi:hypothetical protein
MVTRVRVRLILTHAVNLHTQSSKVCAWHLRFAFVNESGLLELPASHHACNESDD